MNVVLALESVCVGGGHATISVTIDGGNKRIFTLDADEIREPVGDKEALLVSLAKLSVTGLTRAQARAKLQAGIAITL